MLKEDGSRRINENTLVAITLMIAESRAADKDVICRMAAQLIS